MRSSWQNKSTKAEAPCRLLELLYFGPVAGVVSHHAGIELVIASPPRCRLHGSLGLEWNVEIGYRKAMTTAVKKIIEEVKALTPAERRELEAALEDAAHPKPTASPEDEVLQRLAAQGIITLATRPLGEASPVPITGQPVSEILIADRR